MRTIPKTKFKDDVVRITDTRIQNATRIVAIGFILLIQLAIVFKMLT